MRNVKIGKNVYVDVGANMVDVNIIQAKTPVRTGALRDGFYINDGDICNDVDYVDVVENGTPHRRGVYMIERSLPEISRRVEKRVYDQLADKKLLPDITIKVRAF